MKVSLKCSPTITDPGFAALGEPTMSKTYVSTLAIVISFNEPNVKLQSYSYLSIIPLEIIIIYDRIWLMQNSGLHTIVCVDQKSWVSLAVVLYSHWLVMALLKWWSEGWVYNHKWLTNVLQIVKLCMRSNKIPTSGFQLSPTFNPPLLAIITIIIILR